MNVITMQQNSVNLEAADTLEILILQQLIKLMPVPSASMVETENNPESIERDPNAPEPAAE
jgi:hypothetical protein